jgi:hypothetical protein
MLDSSSLYADALPPVRQGYDSRQGWHDVSDQVHLGAHANIVCEAETHQLLPVSRFEKSFQQAGRLDQPLILLKGLFRRLVERKT